MRDTKKYATSKMGFSTSSIPGHILPEGEIEDTCPLCGHFSPLDNRGYCGEEKCNDAARQTIREMVRKNGGKNIPGMYYKFGDQEIFVFTKLPQWEEPKPVKHPDMCQSDECTDWSLPADYLCRHHRLVETREEFRRGKPLRNKKPGHVRPKMHGHKIRGLDKIKL